MKWHCFDGWKRLQNLLRRFCKRSIQKPVFSIQNWNPLTGNVFYYSDSCILYSDFSLANTPEGVLQEPQPTQGREQ